MKTNYPELGNPGGKKHPEGAEITHPSGKVYRRVGGHWVLVKLLLISLLFLAPPAEGAACNTTGSGSALQNAADNLTTGWCEFTANGISTFLTATHASGCSGGGSSKAATSYVTKGVWDAVRKIAWFHGSDHACRDLWAKYTESTNTWSISSELWSGAHLTDQNPPDHGYDHIAIDVRGRRLYMDHFGNPDVIDVMDLDTEEWLTPIDWPTGLVNTGADNRALTFHPDIGTVGKLLIMTCGGSCSSGLIIAYDPAVGTWAAVDTFTGTASELHPGSAYSEESGVAIFGGGNSVSTTVWRADSFRSPNYGLGEVTVAATAPRGWGAQSTDQSQMRVHPAPGTGKFIALWDLEEWYEFDPLEGSTGTWTELTGTHGQAEIFATNNCNEVINCLFGIPISTHGVIMYIKCPGAGGCFTWLYKHEPFTAADRDFKQRCAQPGVLRCEGFETSRFESYLEEGDRCAMLDATLTTSQKASGNQAVRFTRSAGQGVGSSTWVYCNVRDTASVKFSEGETFYVQYRVRFSSATLSGSVPGFKQSIIGTGDLTTASRASHLNIEDSGTFATTCTHLEIVDQYTSGRSNMWGAYHACPNTREGDSGSVRSFDGRECAGANNPQTGCVDGNDFQRQHVDNCTRNGLQSGCEIMQPDEWLTVKTRVTVGTPYNNDQVYFHDSTVQKWIAREGQASRLIFDARQQGNTSCDESDDDDPSCKTGVDLYNDDPTTYQYGKVWLLPYSASVAFPNGMTIDYDELIISTEDIADPGETSSSEAPEAPTGLTISRAH